MNGRATPIVLLPGLDGTGRMFDPLLDVLPSSVSPEVVRYPPDRPMSDEDLGRHIERFLPHGEPFILLAESFSGPAAIRIAASRPHGIAALVLVATFAAQPLGALTAAARLFSGPFVFRQRPPRWALRRFLLGGDAPESLVDALVQSIGEVSPDVIADRVHRILTCDLSAPFATVSVPVLILEAGRDALISRRCGRRLVELQPKAKHVVIDAPHLLLQRRPVEASAAISDFLSQGVDRAILEV